nr:NADH dehydrogenase subunit 6 [Pneumocystis sp. 'macacae']
MIILNIIGIIFSIMVVSSRNPVVSLLYLIGLFVDVAVYLISINLTYLGLAYIIVYVGAIAMLFIFVIMMLNIQTIERSKDRNLLVYSLPLGLLLGIFFIFPISEIIPNEIKFLYNFFLYLIKDKSDWISKIYVLEWQDRLTNPTIVESVGNVLYTQYSIWLLIISLIFVLAMIGSICIAAPKD